MNQNTNPPPSASKPKEIKLNIPPVLKIVLGLLFAIDATVIPLSFTYEWAATIALPALAIVTFLAMVIKNRDLSIGFVMLVPGALLWMMTGSYIITCLWVIALALIGGTAYLLRGMHLLLWLLIPIVSFGASFAAVGAPLPALSCLIFFPAALALHSSISTAKTRTGAIAMTAAALVFSFVAAALFALYAKEGHLSVDSVKTVLDKFRHSVETQVYVALNQQVEMIKTVGYEISVSTEEVAQTLVTTLFNFLPGIVILLCLVVGWCAQPMPFILHQRVDPDAPVPVTARVLVFSPVTGAVYIISQILGIFYSFTDNAVLLVFANVALILCPGLALNGLGYLFGRRAAMRAGGRPAGSSPMPFIIFIGLLVMLLFGLTFAAYLLIFFALLGGYSSIAVEVRRYLRNKNGNNDSSNS